MLDTIRILLEKCDDKSIEMLLEYIREIKLTEEASITEQGKMNCCGCSRMTSSYNENQMLYLSLLSEECNVPNIVRRLISEMGITPKYKAHEYIVQGCDIIISKGDISSELIDSAFSDSKIHENCPFFIVQLNKNTFFSFPLFWKATRDTVSWHHGTLSGPAL